MPGDIIILHMCTINDNNMRYGSWDIKCNRQNFLSFWTIFCPFQNFEKMKKTPRDIIILHKCNINGNHIMYGSQNMKCDREHFFSFWTVFCCFTPLTTQKIKILKNCKNTNGDIIILHKCNKNHYHMLYCSLHLVCNRFNYFSFWAIFYPFTTLRAQKIQI